MKKRIFVILFFTVFILTTVRGNQAVITAEEVEQTSVMTENEFDSLLKTLPISVVATRYMIQSDSLKSIYPDLLQAIIRNVSAGDIKNVTISFVAWDKNNLPVKIKGQYDSFGGSYIKSVNYKDINLVSGDTYGGDIGLALSASCDTITTFKAIVKSYETFDGEIWDNPYYEAWCGMYEGIKYTDSLTCEVVIVPEELESENTEVETENTEKDTSREKDLEENINGQDICVISTDYIVQNDNLKSIYPDMLQAILKNNSKDIDVKDAKVAFVAWDKNGLPVKIKGQIDISNGAYVKVVSYNDINLAPGMIYGEKSGFALDANTTIKTFKAIVKSYETFNGDIWENPYFEEWEEMYSGKKMK